MKLSGAEIFIECLKAEKVDTIFGYPGGAVLFLYDELYKAENRGDIRHILARHEQGARSHACLLDYQDRRHDARCHRRRSPRQATCRWRSGPQPPACFARTQPIHYRMYPSASPTCRVTSRRRQARFLTFLCRQIRVSTNPDHGTSQNKKDQ